MQERQRLAARHGKRVPLLVKISPDLAAAELTRSVPRTASDIAVDGVIATNTSTDVPELRSELEASRGGGVSGAPLTQKSLADAAPAAPRARRRTSPSSASAES